MVLRDLLKLFHPAIPFVTEELWSHLVGDGLLATSRWPEPPAYPAPPSMDAFQSLVTGIRRFRADHGIAPRREGAVRVAGPSDATAEWWGPQLEALAHAKPDFGPMPVDPAGLLKKNRRMSIRW